MAVEIKVDLKNPVQSNFLGNNAVYHGYAGMPDKDGRVYSNELCELEADRAAALGIRVARTFYKWYAWEPETKTWNWENADCKGFYGWLERMKKRGIHVALNTGWVLPGDIDGTGWNANCPFVVEGNWAASVENYAKWVSETLHQLIEVRGFDNIKYILLFTEPQYAARLTETPDNKHAYELWKDCAEAVNRHLLKDRRRHLVKIIGPNEGSTSTSVMNEWVAKNADEYLDIYSSHNYQDFIADENSGDLNDTCILLNFPGARIQQKVQLKPNTEYRFSVKVKPVIADKRTTSGSIIIGAWSAEDVTMFSLAEAGGNPTTRLHPGSTKMYDPSSMADGISEIDCVFNSGECKECYVAVFNDIKENGSKLQIYFCSLTENGSNINLLNDSDITQTPLRRFYGVSDCTAFNGNGWRGICEKKNFLSDPYYYLRECAQTTIDYVKSTNKPVWFDEYNTRSEKDDYDKPLHGTHLAANMQSIMNSGVQSSLMWTLFDQQWPNSHTNNNDCFVNGDHRCGIMPVLTRSLVPYPAYYAVALVMKYMGGDEGTCIYEGEGKNLLHATVSKMPDGNFSVLVINNKGRDDEFILDFGENINLKLNRYIYNPETIKPDEKAELIKKDSVVEVKNTLSDYLPANCVAVYTTY